MFLHAFLDILILANCGNKIYTGGATPINELEWWASEIGKWKEWKYDRDFNGETGEMSNTFKNPSYSYTLKLVSNRLQTLGQNRCAYKLINDGGKNDIGEGIMSFVASKHKEKHSGKTYNFSAYSTGTAGSEDADKAPKKSKRFNPKKLDFIDESDGEMNPIQNAEKKYSFDNEEGAIVIDLKNDNN